MTLLMLLLTPSSFAHQFTNKSLDFQSWELEEETITDDDDHDDVVLEVLVLLVQVLEIQVVEDEDDDDGEKASPLSSIS